MTAGSYGVTPWSWVCWLFAVVEDGTHGHDVCFAIAWCFLLCVWSCFDRSLGWLTLRGCFLLCVVVLGGMMTNDVIRDALLGKLMSASCLMVNPRRAFECPH